MHPSMIGVVPVGLVHCTMLGKLMPRNRGLRKNRATSAIENGRGNTRSVQVPGPAEASVAHEAEACGKITFNCNIAANLAPGPLRLDVLIETQWAWKQPGP